MGARVKSIVMLFATLVLGCIIGGLVVGALSQERAKRMDKLRKPGGFVHHMMEIIEPRDSAQQRAIRPILRRTDGRNREIVDGSRKRMKDVFDSMLVELSPLLEPEQMERLREARKHRPRRPPGMPHPDGSSPTGERRSPSP